ncbi:STAS domain-containing protein [Nonomuraea maritima]|uniref:STAS domain-containing protein n=1 Tax=Nonomuraea maritima TaxID=683260 RepID=UPI0037102BCD
MLVRLGPMTGERGPRPGSGPHVVVVEVSGALDMDTCPALQERLGRALSLHHPPLLALGLGGVTCADSYGLTVLLAADRHARDRGGRMVAYAAGLTLRKTLRERGVDRVLDVRPALADALRELRAAR